ncbi:MAG: formamidopyrimidine-DNA glycosylase [Pelagibacterales bacterium]|nr:formamidopyrimidine-DNA glycosylase [Pelagibacterales bacterium]
MPELPEIEIIKKSLVKMLINTKIIKIKINNRNLRYKIPPQFSKNLIGQKILKISRRSKYLIFHFKKKILLAHMGMSGKLVFTKLNEKKIYKTSFYYNLNLLKKHNHIYFKFNNGLKLIYNDVRRFGFFKLYNNEKLNKINFLKKLGPEPFSKSFNLIYFTNFTKNRETKIKNLLMDQSFVSGIGNIYSNEALFMSKIAPLRKSRSLNSVEIKRLILNIKKILKFSILKGGSSIKDFKNTAGKKGVFQEFFNVYGRNNKKCSRISCNGKIYKIKISGRSSYYCDSCQT